MSDAPLYDLLMGIAPSFTLLGQRLHAPEGEAEAVLAQVVIERLTDASDAVVLVRCDLFRRGDSNTDLSPWTHITRGPLSQPDMAARFPEFAALAIWHGMGCRAGPTGYLDASRRWHERREVANFREV